MMKKLSLLVGLLLVFQLIVTAGPVDTKKVSITLGAGVRNFSESGFKDVYTGTALTYNVDLAVKLFGSMEAFFHTDYLTIDGELTFTKEPTTLKIFPLEVGLRYLVAMKKSEKQKIYPYLGAGAGYYMIKEENEIGNLDEKRVGFFFEGGIRFYFTGAMFLDVKLKNVMVKSENDTKMGGFSYMGGVGFAF
jgi:outer membrane protein W